MVAAGEAKMGGLKIGEMAKLAGCTVKIRSKGGWR